MNLKHAVCIALVLVTTSACVSSPLTIKGAPVGPNEKVIGDTQGSSTGIMLFGVIPINQNTRFVDAYQDALGKVGGTRLVDVTIEEQWFWALVLNGFIFKVSGKAVATK